MNLLIWAWLATSSMAGPFTPVTGPSYGNAEIIPVAYNWDGQVLCKTYYTLNEMGAHAIMPAKFTWLVVSREGLWEEFPLANIPGEFEPNGLDWEVMDDSLAKAYRILRNPVDWESPPGSLRKVFEKYEFSFHIESSCRRSGILEDQYFLQNGNIYDGHDSLIVKDVELKHINGVHPDGKDHARIGNAYFIRGMVFFNSYCIFEPSTACAGPSYFRDVSEWGLDSYKVTGVAVVPFNEEDE